MVVMMTTTVIIITIGYECNRKTMGEQWEGGGERTLRLTRIEIT
jgi:hypothetical protein